MTFDTVFFIGPQGSGKGTQARLLAEQLGFFYWEMGGILREVAKSGTELGNKVGQLIDQGVLLTDDILLDVVKQKISSIPKEQGIIFDGIPRRLGQARFLLDYLHSIGHQKFVTLFIDVPRAESLARLLKRAEVEHRKDDTEAKINFRLDQYEQDTLPVLDYLRQHSTFISIDGKPPVLEVTELINQALQGL